MSESSSVPSLVVDETLLRNAFQVSYLDDKGFQNFTGLFKPAFLHDTNKQAVLSVIAADYNMVSLVDEYVAMAGEYNEIIKSRAAFRSRNAEHFRCFAGAMQCLLGMPEYKDRVMSYLRKHLDEWRLMSFGFLGGSGMYGVAGDASKHRASCVFSSLLKADPADPISNLCRDQSGLVLSPEVFDTILLLESDAHGFLMSAIANRDREAIEGLMCSGTYLRFISREHTLMRIADCIEDHPEWELDEFLRPLLALKNHETAMSSLKHMIDATGSTVSQFMTILWPGISPLAVSHLVAYAINSKRDFNSAKNFMVSCVESGLDLSLGVIEALRGFGAALDEFQSGAVDTERYSRTIENYLWLAVGGGNKAPLAPILASIPPEILATHASASDLLLERYALTGEKSLLDLGNRDMRGRALEIDMGL